MLPGAVELGGTPRDARATTLTVASAAAAEQGPSREMRDNPRRTPRRRADGPKESPPQAFAPRSSPPVVATPRPQGGLAGASLIRGAAAGPAGPRSRPGLSPRAARPTRATCGTLAPLAARRGPGAKERRRWWSRAAAGLVALGLAGPATAEPATAEPPSAREYRGPEASPEPPDDVLPPSGEAKAAGQGAQADQRPAQADDPTSEQGITAVSVKLRVFRGGDRLPSGEKLRRSRGAVDGEAVYTLARPAKPGEQVHLLNFAETLREEPKELDTITLSTYLDGPFDRGRMEITGHEGATRVASSENREHLSVTLAEGATELVVRYRVKVPHRYWPFGCARRRCSLSGAVAPLPAKRATGGRYLPEDGWVIAPARWTVDDARFAAVPSWRPGSQPTKAEAEALRGQEIVVAEAPLSQRGLASYPSVFWGPKWRRTVEIHNGVRLEFLHTLWRPPDHYPDERRAQLYRDVPGHIIEALKDVLDVAAATAIEPPPDARMLVVQGPLRSTLAEAHPTSLLISDQIFQIFPVERFLEFHAEVVARSGFDVLTHAFFAGRHDPSVDHWLQGALAMALLDLWRARRAHRDEFASDLLGRLTFVPAVDNFLYAGQAEFTAAYFRGSEDTFAIRNHPWLAFNALPTGRRLYEKLRDLLPASATAAFYAHLTQRPDDDPIRAAQLAYGRALGWFFDQWLGPYPEVDYRVAAVESSRVGDRWRHRITIRRDSDVPLIEPVQVLATDRAGENYFLVWNGELGPDDAATAKGEDGQRGQGSGLDAEPASGEHTFVIDTQARLAAVTVDPRSRLNEAARAPVDNVDPLYNNRKPAAPRFLYTGFGLNLAISEFLSATSPESRLGAVSGFAFFEASRRRDMRATGHFMIYRARETAAGLGAGTNIWVGRKKNRKRRVGRVRLFSNLELLTDEGLDPRGGLRVSELVAYVHDTRRFSLWPDRGRRIYGLIGASQVLRLDGRGDDNRYALSAEAGWVELWPLAHRHVLASRLEASAMLPIGSEPEFRSLLRAGGIGELGAYSGNEIFGRAIAKAQLEYRHTFYDNLNVNLGHLAWLRGVGGTLFTGTASVSSCDDYSGMFGKESWYGQVGYGVTAFLRVLGVTPQFFRVDLTVPLVRRRTLCLGNVLPDYLAEQQGLSDPEVLLPPVSVNVTFLQPF